LLGRLRLTIFKNKLKQIILKFLNCPKIKKQKKFLKKEEKIKKEKLSFSFKLFEARFERKRLQKNN